MIKSRYNSNLFYKSNHLVTSFFACNDYVYITEIDLVTKKKESSISLYIFPRFLQSLSSFFSLNIFKYILIYR